MAELKILLVEDSDSFRQEVAQMIGVYNDVDEAPTLAAARDRLKSNSYAVVILDKNLPDGSGIDLIPTIKHDHPGTVVIVVTADREFREVKKCMNAGADDYVVKSSNTPADLLVRIPFVTERAAEKKQLRSLQDQVREAFRNELVGRSRETLELRQQIRDTAGSNSHVLILGETGTGKELVAHMVNKVAKGKNRQMVTLNCNSFTKDLIEVELFGSVKGAFTGAIDKPGKFDLADNGDLFLDEIGDLPLSAQGKFLRVLENGTFYRVGGSQPIRVSCRVIAATHRNLKDMVAKGTFREDLYYRLNHMQLKTSPLRNRIDDIPDLAHHFVRNSCGTEITISEEAIQRLMTHNWPGNIREFRNTIERAIIRVQRRTALNQKNNDSVINAQDLLIENNEDGQTGLEAIRAMFPLKKEDLRPELWQEFMEIAEREFFRASIDLVKGSAQEASDLLDLGRSTIFKKLSQFNLPRRPYGLRFDVSGDVSIKGKISTASRDLPEKML